MNKFLESFISIVILLLIFCFIPTLTMALGDPANDPDTPIDGGVSILVVAGVAYGIKKIRDERRKNLNNQP